MFFWISFPFARDVFAAVVRTKDGEFSSGSALNFLVPGLEGNEVFTLLAKKVVPGVAPRVIRNSDEVALSTERYGAQDPKDRS